MVVKPKYIAVLHGPKHIQSKHQICEFLLKKTRTVHFYLIPGELNPDKALLIHPFPPPPQIVTPAHLLLHPLPKNRRIGALLQLRDSLGHHPALPPPEAQPDQVAQLGESLRILPTPRLPSDKATPIPQNPID